MCLQTRVGGEICLSDVIMHKGHSLRAIFRENRKSQDTREKIEFFFLLPKHPFWYHNSRKNSFGFK